jgi:PRTRC genetic system protein B
MKNLSFDIVAAKEAPLRLSQAILLYSGDSNICFASVHSIDASGKQPVILEGQAFTSEAAVRLALDLSSSAMKGGFVPPELLYLDGNAMAWWVPPGRRHIAFRAEQLGARERGEVVPHPGLVFLAEGGRRWSVWAVKGDGRPSEDTPLYQAPYFNVYENGGICTGNVRLPDGTTAERIHAWNKAFFGSFFTHPNVQGKLVNYRGGTFKFWMDMLNGRHHEFPEHALVSRQMTLADALKLRACS